jgi:hypothetical protein
MLTVDATSNVSAITRVMDPATPSLTLPVRRVRAVYAFALTTPTPTFAERDTALPARSSALDLSMSPTPNSRMVDLYAD